MEEDPEGNDREKGKSEVVAKKDCSAPPKTEAEKEPQTIYFEIAVEKENSDLNAKKAWDEGIVMISPSKHPSHNNASKEESLSLFHYFCGYEVGCSCEEALQKNSYDARNKNRTSEELESCCQKPKRTRWVVCPKIFVRNIPV